MWSLSRVVLILLIVGVSVLYRRVNDCLGPLPAPKLPPDQWWGDDEPPSDWQAYIANTSGVVGNRLIYPPETIDALRSQLNRTWRYTEPLEGVAFEYGFNTKYLREIVNYWRDDYLPRWRSRELFLWQFNHFTTEIQGLRLHYLNLMVYDEQKEGKHHYPVLLLHGWPSSVRVYYELIRKLHAIEEKSDYIFNVIVPSLPGYGWSQGTSKPGLGPAQIAVIMQNLMTRLGYDKYFIHGGDWGGLIGSHMATLYPDSVLGYHSDSCGILTTKAMLKGFIAGVLPSLFAPKGYEDFYFPQADKFQFIIEESGYYHLQATKPDTIGTVLTDNPIGLAAYILEKFSTWTNPAYRKVADGGLTKHFKLDALLDNVMIYYLTNSITTSQRLYAEIHSAPQLALGLDRVPTPVPTGCVRFKHFAHFLDFQLRDKYTNLIHSTYYRDGGHFAAMQLPDVMYHDFIEFVKKAEKFYKLK